MSARTNGRGPTFRMVAIFTADTECEHRSRKQGRLDQLCIGEDVVWQHVGSTQPRAGEKSDDEQAGSVGDVEHRWPSC